MKKPTHDECSRNAEVPSPHPERKAFALYGYGSVAVVVPGVCSGPGGVRGCTDIYVWHDGEFSMPGDNDEPYMFHIDDHDQWKDFADKLAQINERAGGMK